MTQALEALEWVVKAYLIGAFACAVAVSLVVACLTLDERFDRRN